MKGNLDSLVVIIVTLLFLVITGLSKRRKKKPVLNSNLQFKQQSARGFKGKDLFSDAVTMINDPFSKLEKIFNIPEETQIQEGESLEVTNGMELGSAETTTGNKTILEEIPIEKEAKSLEVIVDEVQEYLKNKEIQKSGIKAENKFDEQDLTKLGKPDSRIQDQKKKPKIPLFENADELKKALIYSEILKRKEY
jgi:hypothetical protein